MDTAEVAKYLKMHAKTIVSMVERGEELLRSLGLTELRLRHHGEVARVEIPVADLARVLEPGVRERLVAGLKALGYRYVTLDLEGFRSGSLNAGVAPAPEPDGKEGSA